MSVPSVAVDLALSVLGGLEERHVVILGAGETSELTARALADQGAGTIFVANRHADRALSLAQRFGGSVVGLDGLPDQLLHADIVLSSTSSPHPIVGREELELVMRERAGRPLLLIDIAVPRDIDPACGELEGVTLYDIDDLQAVVARNLDTRAGEAPRAQEIVEEEIQRFARWLGQLDVLPTVSALREHGNALVEQVLAENAGRWESASPRDLARVEAIARAVMSRLLHEPTIRLRSLSEARGHASLELVRELFGLRDEDRRRRGRTETHPRSSPRSTTSSAAARAEASLMRIGTRGSALALAQAGHVAEIVGGPPARRADHDHDERGFGCPPTRARRGQVALGRHDRGRRCWPVRSTWRCTRPRTCRASWPTGCRCWARPRGRAPRTCCAARPRLEALPAGARVGTSSVRRVAQLRAAREDLRVVTHRRQRRHAPAAARRVQPTDDRGTRGAGRRRSSARDRARARRAAAARPRGGDRRGARPGTLRAGSRPGRARARGARGRHARGEAVRAITDADAFACLLAERALARELDASCHTPLGAHAVPAGCGCLPLRAWVGLPDGSAWSQRRAARRLLRARRARAPGGGANEGGRRRGAAAPGGGDGGR